MKRQLHDMVMYKALKISPAWRIELLRHYLDFIKVDQGTLHCHHVTLQYDVDEYDNDFNYETTIMFTHAGVSSSGVMALKPFLNKRIECKQDNPHMTVFVPHGASAKDANTITNWEPLLSPWIVDVNEKTLRGKTPTPIVFSNKAEVMAWLYDRNYEYMDNVRYSVLSDAASYTQYEIQKANGCCRFVDQLIIVGQELAMIGCNYGH